MRFNYRKGAIGERCFGAVSSTPLSLHASTSLTAKTFSLSLSRFVDLASGCNFPAACQVHPAFRYNNNGHPQPALDGRS